MQLIRTLTLFTALLGKLAVAQWTLTSLGPNNRVWGVTTMNQQVGQSNVFARPHASLWSGTASSWVDLNPAISEESVAYGVSGSTQVGLALVGGVVRASLWSGTAASWIDLHPAGSTSSRAVGVSGPTQVGYAVVAGVSHASLWSGTAASWLDLNPPGALYSNAYGVSGASQVGDAYFAGDRHASLWAGTAASWVDLNPAGEARSTAYGVSGPNQVGVAVVDGVSRASLWSGTSSSWVDLNPAGSSGSAARAVWGSNQVGEANVGGANHASLWSGTANSWVDLNPPGYTFSYATGISSDGVTDSIVGWGSTTSGQESALLWTRPAGSPPRTVSGHVIWAGGGTLSSVSVQFRSAGTLTNVGSPITALIDEHSAFTVVSPAVTGNYDLSVKPAGFLRRTINTNTTSGNVTNANLNLVPGDIVADNAIDLSDYTVLVIYFNRTSADPTWNTLGGLGVRPSDCDLNGDGVVDLTDYILVVTNFNTVGDN